MSELKLEQLIVLVLIAIILITGIVVLLWQNFSKDTIVANLNQPVNNHTLGTKENPTKKTEKEERIIVHVAGEVNRPGVFSLQEGARVIDGIKVAGGETALADLNRLNLAAILYDGERIYIPRQESQGEVAYEEIVETTSKININRASQEELEKLTGIGPSKASSIISYRKREGPFQEIDDLMKVSGIGERTLEQIRDELTLR